MTREAGRHAEAVSPGFDLDPAFAPLLHLQRAAGNRAVNTLLWEPVQRQKEEEPPPWEPPPQSVGPGAAAEPAGGAKKAPAPVAGPGKGAVRASKPRMMVEYQLGGGKYKQPLDVALGIMRSHAKIERRSLENLSKGFAATVSEGLSGAHAMRVLADKYYEGALAAFDEAMVQWLARDFPAAKRALEVGAELHHMANDFYKRFISSSRLGAEAAIVGLKGIIILATTLVGAGVGSLVAGGGAAAVLAGAGAKAAYTHITGTAEGLSAAYWFKTEKKVDWEKIGADAGITFVSACIGGLVGPELAPGAALGKEFEKDLVSKMVEKGMAREAAKLALRQKAVHEFLANLLDSGTAALGKKLFARYRGEDMTYGDLTEALADFVSDMVVGIVAKK